MILSPALPTGTLTPTATNRGSMQAFAHRFVVHGLANTMPEGSLDTTLDLVIQLRALRPYYAEYQALTSLAAVDLAHVPLHLTPGTAGAGAAGATGYFPISAASSSFSSPARLWPFLAAWACATCFSATVAKVTCALRLLWGSVLVAGRAMPQK